MSHIDKHGERPKGPRCQVARTESAVSRVQSATFRHADPSGSPEEALLPTITRCFDRTT